MHEPHLLSRNKSKSPFLHRVIAALPFCARVRGGLVHGMESWELRISEGSPLVALHHY